jgi:hypothetical protein
LYHSELQKRNKERLNFQDLTFFFVDFCSRHSLSAGGPGASSAHFALAGSPLDTLFPQESRAFCFNQPFLKNNNEF